MTQFSSQLFISKKVPTLNLSQENSKSNFSQIKAPASSNLIIISKSCERSKFLLRKKNSTDLGYQENMQYHKQISNKSIKVLLKPRDLTPNSQLINQQITILKFQIQNFSLQNAEIRKSLQNNESPRIKSLKSELKLLKTHHKFIKSKIKAQQLTLNQPKPTTSPDPEDINILKSAHISQSRNFKSKFADLKHQILLTSQSIETFSKHLSEKKLSCRKKLLKIQETLRKKRKSPKILK